MAKAVNDATEQKAGDIYQYLIALDYALRYLVHCSLLCL